MALRLEFGDRAFGSLAVAQGPHSNPISQRRSRAARDHVNRGALRLAIDARISPRSPCWQNCPIAPPKRDATAMRQLARRRRPHSDRALLRRIWGSRRGFQASRPPAPGPAASSRWEPRRSLAASGAATLCARGPHPAASGGTLRRARAAAGERGARAQRRRRQRAAEAADARRPLPMPSLLARRQIHGDAARRTGRLSAARGGAPACGTRQQFRHDQHDQHHQNRGADQALFDAAIHCQIPL